MTLDLSGRVAVVTGASRGIGYFIAKELAAAGAHVIAVARTVGGLEELDDQIKAAGGQATLVPLDLADMAGIDRLGGAIHERWGKLDILVINAALLPQLTPVTQIEQQFFNRALTLNVLATQALLANFDPLLKRAEAGRVIGVTSWIGQNPRAYWGAYGATKAAFDNLLGAYAQEVGNISNVRVAILDPGATRTQMRARAYPGEDPATVKSPEVVGERIAALVGEDFETGTRIRMENPA